MDAGRASHVAPLKARPFVTAEAKKSATGKPRRQSLEIFFVNEKVCFGKQKFQYSVPHQRD